MIYLPLEHIETRYTTHMDRDIVAYLRKKGVSFTYLAPEVLSNEIRHGSFLDADNTIYRQFHQFNELISLLLAGKVSEDETLWVSDIWDFALLAVPYLNYFSGYRLKVRGFLHAGSFTDTDFVRQLERYYKCMEDTLFDICDEIYVGSNFMKTDLLKKRYINPDKVIVTGLPLDYVGLAPYKGKHEKENLVVFNGRNVDEKQPYLFDLLQKRLPGYKYINTQAQGLSKAEYYDVLSRAKVIVSFALQENFGFGVQEAVHLGCIPVLPDRLAYVEQFAPEYRYRNFDECVDKVAAAMAGELKPTSPTYPDNDKIFATWFSGLF